MTDSRFGPSQRLALMRLIKKSLDLLIKYLKYCRDREDAKNELSEKRSNYISKNSHKNANSDAAFPSATLGNRHALPTRSRRSMTTIGTTRE